MSNLYGYARVSSVQQDLVGQVEALEGFGVPAENILKEKMSGKTAKDRPIWSKLYQDLKDGDTLVVHKLDRMGRSVTDVVNTIEDLNNRGVGLVIIDLNIDTRREQSGISNAMTKAMLTMIAAFAEVERTMIQERTAAGIERAKAAGVKFGAKQKNVKSYEKAIELYLSGSYTVKECIEEFDGLTEATFYRRLAQYKKQQQEARV